MAEKKRQSKHGLRGCWDALRKLSYGVYVVAARRGDGEDSRINAMTVRFMTQISARPPRIALMVLKARLTHDFNDGVVVNGRNELKVVVTDNAGNSAIFETYFFRNQ